MASAKTWWVGVVEIHTHKERNENLLNLYFESVGSKVHNEENVKVVNVQSRKIWITFSMRWDICVFHHIKQ